MVTHSWTTPERPTKPRTHVTRTGQHVCQSTYIPRAVCLTYKHTALNQRIRKKKEGTLNYLCSYLFLLSSPSPGRQDSGEVFMLPQYDINAEASNRHGILPTQREGYPNRDIFFNVTSSSILILRPSTTIIFSLTKAESVRMAFEVVMFERLARSSRAI